MVRPCLSKRIPSFHSLAHGSTFWMEGEFVPKMRRGGGDGVSGRKSGTGGVAPDVAERLLLELTGGSVSLDHDHDQPFPL